MNWRAFFRIAVLVTTAGFLTATGGSSGQDCKEFGQQNCKGADNAGCYNNTCQCCWGVQSSVFQCYNCAEAACGARGYACASNHLCVFPPPPAGPACDPSSAGGCPTPPNCGTGTHQVNCTCVPN